MFCVVRTAVLWRTFLYVNWQVNIAEFYRSVSRFPLCLQCLVLHVHFDYTIFPFSMQYKIYGNSLVPIVFLFCLSIVHLIWLIIHLLFVCCSYNICTLFVLSLSVVSSLSIFRSTVVHLLFISWLSFVHPLFVHY